MRDGTTVISLCDRVSRRSLQRRRADVSEALRDTLLWITAGLEGACSLEEAVCSASCSLRRAEREVMTSSLEA
jgi:hypothetical protein